MTVVRDILTSYQLVLVQRTGRVKAYHVYVVDTLYRLLLIIPPPPSPPCTPHLCYRAWSSYHASRDGMSDDVGSASSCVFGRTGTRVYRFVVTPTRDVSSRRFGTFPSVEAHSPPKKTLRPTGNENCGAEAPKEVYFCFPYLQPEARSIPNPKPFQLGHEPGPGSTFHPKP